MKSDERKRKKQLIGELEEMRRYRTVAGLISEFAYSYFRTSDAGYKVDWVTDEFYKLSGYSEDELREQGSWMFASHPDDKAMVTELFNRLKEGESDTKEFRIVTKEGRVLNVINYIECVADPDAPGALRLYGRVQNITQRKQVEDKLAYLASFPEKNPNPVLELDNEGNIKYMNPVTTRIFSDIAKLGVNHPFLTDWAQVVKELRDNNWSKPVNREVKVNGSFYEQVISPVTKKQMHVYGINMTELKQAEDALRQSEEKYRQLVNNLREGIWVIDKDSCTTFVNPSMAEMLGYKTDEMLGRPLFSFMDEQGVKLATQLLARRKEGVKEQHDFEFLRKDGTRAYFSLETSPITDKDGNYIGAIAGVQDVTERRRMQGQLIMQDRLASIGQLVSGVAP